MKLRILLIILAIVGINMLMPNNAMSQKKYYIIFDNFEDQKDGNGTTITNLFDLCYWNILRNDAILGKYAEKKPFSAATFLARDITEYDVAVFVMGAQFNLNASVDGIVVLDKIKQMLAANKSVVIIGSAILPMSFATGGDAATKTWLTSYMGVRNVKQVKHEVSGTIYGFRVDGIEGDPVSAGYKKQCNRIYEENGAGLQGPIRWYNASYFCEVQGGKNAVAFDNVKEIAGQDITEQVVAGIRTEENKARCIFYTVNFDIVSGTHLSHYNNSLTRGIRWAVRDVPAPEGFLALENEAIDFGIIEPKQSGYQIAVIQNNGREKVKISEFKIAGDEAPGSFEIVEGNQPIELAPGDIHQLNIKFTPTEEKLYEEYINIKSDATNGNIEMSLKGTGGAQVFNGPKLSVVSLPIDFGTVPFGLYSEKNVPITNAGNIALVVEFCQIIDDGQKHFTYPEIVKTPITIPPGKTVNVKVRFNSSDEAAGDYTGKISVESNGLGSNLGKGIIELKGRSAGKNTNSGITLSSTSIDFGQIELLKPSEQTLKISNTGSNDLRIFSVIWDKQSGGENLDQFSFLEESNKNIPTLKPGEFHNLKIQFNPKNAKDYAAKIQMLTNDPINEGLIEVPVAGTGKDLSSVNTGTASMVGLTVSINPNPVKEISKVELTLENAGTVKMDLIDASGRKIANLMNNFVNQGVTITDFDAQKYSNGMYFIVVDYNGKQIQLPFIITK